MTDHQSYTFYDHRVTPEGLYIRGHGEGATIYGAMIEIFVPREEAEMFGWIDLEEEGVEEKAPQPLYRHSVFFQNATWANTWEKLITEAILPEDIYQSNDGESGTIEVRFFTKEPLDTLDSRYVIKKAVTYALNCEDEREGED